MNAIPREGLKSVNTVIALNGVETLVWLLFLVSVCLWFFLCVLMYVTVDMFPCHNHL